MSGGPSRCSPKLPVKQKVTSSHPAADCGASDSFPGRAALLLHVRGYCPKPWLRHCGSIPRQVENHSRPTPGFPHWSGPFAERRHLNSQAAMRMVSSGPPPHTLLAEAVCHHVQGAPHQYPVYRVYRKKRLTEPVDRGIMHTKYPVYRVKREYDAIERSTPWQKLT
jgi:hypothetical protein